MEEIQKPQVLLIMKSKKFLDKIIYINITLLVLFTIVILQIFYLTGGVEPSALIYSFFAAFGFENGLCAWIYNTKVKNCKNENSEDSDVTQHPTNNPEEAQDEGEVE